MTAVLAPAISSSGRPVCLHCGLRVDAEASAEFCCDGCESVYGLLHQEHLERYYTFRGRDGVPVAQTRAERRDGKWLEVIEERARSAVGPRFYVTLDIQGVHCVGCVWLVEELFARAAGGERIIVNSSLGRIDLVINRSFDLRAFVGDVERFGYLLGPPVKTVAPTSNDLLWRLGVCAAIAMNSMIFGIAIYAGLQEGPLFDLFTTLNFALGSASVVIGGSVFIRSAIRAARRRLLHLDLPIAVGIVLAFSGSAISYFTHGSKAAYFDTLDVFVTLMLLGRWLQERVLDQNRAWLLASDGAEGLLTRRIDDERVQIVACSDIRPEDPLLITPGDLVPVDARLEGAGASFSLDWIRGESQPQNYGKGDVIPAGAFAAGREAVVMRAKTGFEASALGDLLREPPRALDPARATPWWQRLARFYVIGVLTLSAFGFFIWWVATSDVTKALTVATAVLIVTCPCAFGIAAPLAYELVQAGLRRRGLFVRRASFLDRARRVRRVVFDKTGTLTTGTLALANPEALSALDSAPRALLYQMVARSAHPKSSAIRVALERHIPTFALETRVVEYPGLGIELEHGGRRWRVGQPPWVGETASDTTPYDVAFGVDGAILAQFQTVECLRPHARAEIRALEADGLEVWLLSGDAQKRVEAAGKQTGIAREHCIGDQSPREKARFLDTLDASDTLFVGDGVNDALALDHAYASGTPAVDRPFVPSRADFFFLTPGLAPIRLALRSARVLAQTVRADLGIALGYNILTAGLALGGRMSPLACAVLMPLSSLTTIAVTVIALFRRSPLWKS